MDFAEDESLFSLGRNEDLLGAAGLGAAGAARAVEATGTGRGAGGARIPEAALVAFPPPLPNGLQHKKRSRDEIFLDLLSISRYDWIIIMCSCIIRIEEFLKPLHEFEIILKFSFD